MQKLGTAIKAIINPVDKEAEIASKLQAELQAQIAVLKKQLEEQNKPTQQKSAQRKPITQHSISTTPQKPTIQQQSVKQSIHTQKSISTNVTKPNYIVPYGTKEIKTSQFIARKDLTRVTIPNSVTRIGDYAFQGCSNITCVIIPDSVTVIGKQAFEDCIGLKLRPIIHKNGPWSPAAVGIIYNGTKKQWREIKKESKWNSGIGIYSVHCADGDLEK